VTYRARPRALLVAVAAAMAPALAVPTAARAATAAAAATLTVASGETVELTSTTTLSALTVEEGGTITVPDGYSLTLTVDGVETGSELAELTDGYGGVATAIAAGTYTGTVVLTVATANELAYSTLTFPFRQALYVGAGGVVTKESVLASVVGGTATNTAATGVSITSTGEAFNGVYVSDGSYALTSPEISFTGNGRCDFIGYGAAVLGTGDGATLVLDDATIATKGVVRTAVIADDGSNVVVKNSTLSAADGVLPDEYVPSSDPRYMIVVPWMLGLSGNVRATNLLGTDTRASYVNCDVSSENWGVLSVDEGSGCTLTAINCTVSNTGTDGYGTYAIGDVTEHILGTTFDVCSYATINWGGTVHYGDSTAEAVADLNDSLELGLTATELAALPEQATVINSGRFGVMWATGAPVIIDGGTQITTAETTFLSKSSAAVLTVDGSEGASISSGTGVIFQLMDTDNPGKTTVSGKPWSSETTAVYTEPTGTVSKVSGFDVTSATSTDASATFTDISLAGDFYNSIRGGTSSLSGMNLALTFDGGDITGVITASAAKHNISTITPADYRELGEVTNTAQAVVNNGVIVSLANGAVWTVTGTSYLSALDIAAAASVTAPSGKTVSMTVDGTATAVKAGGSYSGAITLTVA
jgi:hypothetical protein